MNKTTKNILIAALAPAALAIAAPASADVLAGWYDFDDSSYSSSGDQAPANEVAAAGITGGIFSASNSRAGFTSTDGTYGPSESTGENGIDGDLSANGAMGLRTNDPELFLTITNNSGVAISMETLVFDYIGIQGTNLTAVDTIEVYYDSGSLADAANTFIGSVTEVDQDPIGTNTPSDYKDASFALGSVLTDLVLADGEFATFRFVGVNTNATGAGNTPAALDNFAILGSAVPEPGSLALIGLGGLCVLRRRRA